MNAARGVENEIDIVVATAPPRRRRAGLRTDHIPLRVGLEVEMEPVRADWYASGEGLVGAALVDQFGHAAVAPVCDLESDLRGAEVSQVADGGGARRNSAPR